MQTIRHHPSSPSISHINSEGTARTDNIGFDGGIAHTSPHERINGQDKGLEKKPSVQWRIIQIDGLAGIVHNGFPRFGVAYDMWFSTQLWSMFIGSGSHLLGSHWKEHVRLLQVPFRRFKCKAGECGVLRMLCRLCPRAYLNCDISGGDILSQSARLSALITSCRENGSVNFKCLWYR